MAMGISCTADQRDCERAIWNAGLITRFTGKPAQAATASVRNDRGAVVSGAVCHSPAGRTGRLTQSEPRRIHRTRLRTDDPG